MKYLLLVLISSSLFLVTSVSASEQENDLCLLKHLKGTKLDMVTHLIKQACFELHEKKGVSQRRNVEYNNCLLENLPGVESAQAVIEINSACSDLYGN